jgi:cytochrome c
MIKRIVAAAAVLAGLAAAPALAQSPQDLLKANGCLACHAEDKKLVGPSYKEVAAKYAGQPDAVAKLSEKVKKGGVGVWGQVPMPANPQVKDADLPAMVKYILAVK